MKLFIWTSEYQVYLSLAETEDEARTNILLETIFDFNIFDKNEFENALKKEPIILESGSMILNHSNE